MPAEMSAMVEQIYRRARAQYGDQGGQMLPMKLIEDLTVGQVRQLMAERYPIYALADITVESRDVPHDRIVDEIVSALARRLEREQAPAGGFGNGDDTG